MTVKDGHSAICAFSQRSRVNGSILYGKKKTGEED